MRKQLLVINIQNDLKKPLRDNSERFFSLSKNSPSGEFFGIIEAKEQICSNTSLN